MAKISGKKTSQGLKGTAAPVLVASAIAGLMIWILSQFALMIAEFVEEYRKPKVADDVDPDKPT